MDNQSAQQSEQQKAAPEAKSSVQEAQPQAQVQPQSTEKSDAAVEQTREQKPATEQSQDNPSPGNEIKQSTEESKKVESAVDFTSPQVSAPVEERKESVAPVNSQNSAQVNNQSSTAVNSQSLPQTSNQNSAPVSQSVDNVGYQVSTTASNDRLAANSLPHSQLNASSAPSSQDIQFNSSAHDDSSVTLKLFVGGLYYQTEDDVYSFFKQFGEVVD